MAEPKTAPYGSWESPISSDLAVSSSRSLAELTVVGSDVYWLEGRPSEGGRYVIVRRSPDGTIADVTPDGFNSRTRVHEYGGGSFFVSGNTVYFSNFADQRLYRQDSGDDPIEITPESDVESGQRFADGDALPGGRVAVAVQERHFADHEATNEIVRLNLDGSSAPQVLVTGNDFYAFPRVSPDGRRLAWTTWNHPNMPWDGCELWVADLEAHGLSNEHKVAGGDSESIFQPEWSPTGDLYFISDRSNWWNLYRLDGDQIVPVAPMDAEIGVPQWVFGFSRYAFLPDGGIACLIARDGNDHLGVIKPGSDDVATIETGMTTLDYLQVSDDGRIWIIAGSPTEFPTIFAVDPKSGTVERVYRSSDLNIDSGYISVAEPIEFPTEHGLTAHALFYAPNNKDFAGPNGERSPLLVFSHGGPTSATDSQLRLGIQFWTSRGLAVVDVNYGGSTGYGREYRERLKGNWGVVDVDDCVNAALYLAKRGDVDGERLAIRGGSAGGFTTLNSVTFRDVFSAGASYYGLADLPAFVSETHKFESRYLDGLVGPFPEARDIYEERSAAYHTDLLSCPLVLFQGLEDKVVPPHQAELMVEALQRKGLPYAYVAYEGEQHGFRKAENIKHSMEAELYFYSRIFGFEPAGDIAQIKIENL
ncbi:MAG: S9 family peptidase [Nitrolancea sp.]